MKHYVCYTQWNRVWVEATRFEAADHVAAFSRLPEVLPIEHCGRPIALEVIDDSDGIAHPSSALEAAQV